MQAIKSKSSLFLERWASAEHQSQRLWQVTLVLSAVCVAQVFLMGWIMLKPKPIYYIPSAWQAGEAANLMSPQQAAIAFVSAMILNWKNFSPQTAQNAHANAMRFMTPPLALKLNAAFQKDFKDIEQNHISAFYSLKETPQVNAHQSGMVVTLKGQNTVYFGSDVIKDQLETWKVFIRHAKVTEQNPYGFLIEEIEQE